MPLRKCSLVGPPILLGLSILVAASCVNAAEERNPWRGWRTLRMKAKATLLRGQVEMRIVNEPAGRRLETSTEARFLGAVIARSRTTTTFDAEGRVREYVSYTRKRGRRFSFGEDGYSVEKLRPREDAADGEDPWEVYSHREFPAPTRDEGGARARVWDYYGMLLQLREMKLSRPGDEAEAYVATSSGAELYRIRVSESREAEREFVDLATGEHESLPVKELRLTILPADPEAEEGFLNMVGETEIWVEAESKVLLEIVGKIPKVPGKVRIVLAALE